MAKFHSGSSYPSYRTRTPSYLSFLPLLFESELLQQRLESPIVPQWIETRIDFE